MTYNSQCVNEAFIGVAPAADVALMFREDTIFHDTMTLHRRRNFSILYTLNCRIRQIVSASQKHDFASVHVKCLSK